MKKDKIELVNEHWESFTIFNQQGDPTIDFDCTFSLQLIHGEPEVRYLSNGDAGHPATADEIEILDVEIHQINLELQNSSEIVDLNPISKKAFEFMLLMYCEENQHSIEWKSWEKFR